jgi:hypothetical protein
MAQWHGIKKKGSGQIQLVGMTTNRKMSQRLDVRQREAASQLDNQPNEGKPGGGD